MGKTLRRPIRRRLAPPAHRAQPTPQPPRSSSDGVDSYLLPNGETARRYWALPGRILVGGRILSTEDACQLRTNYGVTHNLSAESEQDDEATWLDASTRARFPFPDDGRPIPADLCRGIIAYQRAVLSDPTAVLYCHCRLAGSRGPSLAYAALRVLGRSPNEALAQCGRRKIYTTDIHAAYVESIESALKALPSG
jgi:hypothetical protein